MGVRTRTQNRSIPPLPPCSLDVSTFSVERGSSGRGIGPFASPPFVPPFVCSQGDQRQNTHKGAASHQLTSRSIQLYISAVNAYQNAYQNAPETPSGRTELRRICFFLFFGVFLCFFANPAFFRLSNLSKHKQNASIFARNKHKTISKACHVKQFLKMQKIIVFPIKNMIFRSFKVFKT